MIVCDTRPAGLRASCVTRPSGSSIRVGAPHRSSASRVTLPRGSVIWARSAPGSRRASGLPELPLPLVGRTAFSHEVKRVVGRLLLPPFSVTAGAASLASLPNAS